MATGKALVTADIIAQNTYSDEVEMRGYFNFSLSGTWTAVVFVQRSFDSGSTWLDVESFTENTQQKGLEPEGGVLYRFGVKTGGFGAGTVEGRLSQ